MTTSEKPSPFNLDEEGDEHQEKKQPRKGDIEQGEQKENEESSSTWYKYFVGGGALGFVTFGLCLLYLATARGKSMGEYRRGAFISGSFVGAVGTAMLAVTLYLIIVGHQFTGTLG